MLMMKKIYLLNSTLTASNHCESLRFIELSIRLVFTYYYHSVCSYVYKYGYSSYDYKNTYVGVKVISFSSSTS